MHVITTRWNWNRWMAAGTTAFIGAFGWTDVARADAVTEEAAALIVLVVTFDIVVPKRSEVYLPRNHKRYIEPNGGSPN